MQSTTTVASTDAVQQFIEAFVAPPRGASPGAVRGRILNWVEQANNPALYSKDQSEAAIAELRRKARQNVKRTIAKYPVIAQQLRDELEVKIG